MDGHVSRMYCRFHVLAGSNSAAATVTRLEQAARQHLAESFDAALQQVLGDDPAVYVVRKVEHRLALAGDLAASESEIIRRWGEGLARAVLQSLANGSDGDQSSVCVRFNDRADYVAHFVRDLLAGIAWERWFYGAFASLRPLDRAAALRKVLEEHTQILADILRGLYHDNRLDALLAHLKVDDRRWLWSQVRGPSAESLSQAARSLFTTALELVDRLEGWSRGSPGMDVLFSSYLATGPAPADWRDPTSLAAAVLDALRFLSARGYLKDGICAGKAMDGTLEQALADFDWLDASWLRQGLLALPEKKTAQPPLMPGMDLPLPSWSRTLTPRMRQLLAALAAALRQGERRLNQAFPHSPENALRLYTWLVSDTPGWAGDPSAPALIERLLAAWEWISQAGNPSEVIRSLAKRDITEALGKLSSGFRAAAVDDLEYLAGLGPEGLAVVEALAASSSTRHGGSPDRVRPISPAERPVLDGETPPAPSNAKRKGDPHRTGLASDRSERAGSTGSQPGASLAGHEGDPSLTEPASDRSELTGSAGDRPVIDLESLAAAFNSRRRGHPYSIGQTGDRSELTGSFGGWPIIHMDSAGLALLLRAILDVRLPSLSGKVGFSNEISNLLAALYLGWAGPSGLREGRVEPGLACLAGLEYLPSIEDLSNSWSMSGLSDFETAWLDTLAGQRMLSGAELHLYRLPLAGESGWALVAGDETGMLWPAGRAVQSAEEAARVLMEWRQGWVDATGSDPTIIADDELDDLPSALPIVRAARAKEEISSRHRLGAGRLQAAWATLGHPSPALVPAYLAAFGLLRLWARWLRQFSDSSVPYLLEQFIRCPGRLYPGEAGLWVELEPRPLDIVVELAGYMAPLEGVPWLGGRTVYFRTAGR
jgi:hypothetical protein